MLIFSFALVSLSFLSGRLEPLTSLLTSTKADYTQAQNINFGAQNVYFCGVYRVEASVWSKERPEGTA